MDKSTTDQIEGKLHEVKGAVIAKVGEVISSPDLVAEGNAEKHAGQLQKKVGEIEKVLNK